MAEKANQQIAKWMVRLIGLVLLLAAISAHFLPVEDFYIPEIRSARRAIIAEQFSQNEVAEIELEVRRLWGELESMMSAEQREQFNPPATEEEIASLEYLIGTKLPPDFRAYLKIHNGSKGYRNCLYQRPLSIEDIKQELRQMHGFIDFGRPLNVVKGRNFNNKNLWRPGLVLFAEDDGAGKSIDCATGRVIFWDHDGWTFSGQNESFIELLRDAVESSQPDDINW